MKKYLLTLFVASFPTVAHALSLGNPAEALYFDSNCSYSIRAGFYGDYIYDRYMQVDEPKNHSGVESTEVYTSGAILTGNYCDMVDLFLIFSGSKVALSSPGRSLGASFDPLLEIETRSGFSWGIGARYSYAFCWGGVVGAEAGYFRTSLPISYVRIEKTVPDYIKGVDLFYREWQLALGYSHPIYTCDCSLTFVPYLSLEFSGAVIDMEHATFANFALPDLRNRQTSGFAVGISMLFFKMSSITVEGRFANELALSVQGQIAF